MFYSKSTNGFYSVAIHGKDIPSDAVEITAAEHKALLDGQSQGKIITTDDAGLPCNAEPPVDLENYRSSKNIEINRARDTAINDGVDYGSYRFDSDDRSRANLTATVAAVQAGISLPQGFTWRSAENQDVPFDAANLVSLAAAMLGHVNTQYQKSWTIKAAVSAAGSVEDLDAITW